MIIPYILGVFTSFYLLENDWQIALLFVPGIILLGFYLYLRPSKKFRFDFLFGATLFALTFAFGSFRQFSYTELNSPNHFSKITNNEYLLTQVQEEVFDRESFVRVRLKVKGGFDFHQNLQKEKGSILAYFRKPVNHDFKIGDEIIISSKNIQEVAAPRNPGEFNYKRFLSYQNIYFQVFLNEDEWQSTGFHRKSIQRTASEARIGIIKIIDTLFQSTEHKGFAAALLVGYRNNLNTEIVDSFSKTGTLHVLAVSGLHVGIIFLILNFISKIFKNSKYEHIYKGIIVVVGIWAYAFVTGMSPSVQRAAIMFSIVQGSNMLNKKSMIYNSIFASAFFILLINPFLIVSVSFQLSYTAVLGIVFLQPKIKHWFKPKNRIVKYIWELTAVSLAAQIATFPLGIFYFYQFPLYFLLSNLVVIPAIFVAMLSLIASVSLFWIPFLGNAIILISKLSIDFILWTVSTMHALPNSSFEFLYLTPFQLILLYLFIVSFVWWLFSAQKPSMFFSMIIVLIFFSTALYRYYHIHNQDFAIIHSINKHKVMSIVKGRTVHFISDSAFITDESSQRFYLRPYISEYGLRNINFHTWEDSISQNNFLLDNNILQTKNHTIIYQDHWLLLHDNSIKSNTALVFNPWYAKRLEYLEQENIEIKELEKWIRIE